MRAAIDIRSLQAPCGNRGIGVYVREVTKQLLADKRELTLVKWANLPMSEADQAWTSQQPCLEVPGPFRVGKSYNLNFIADRLWHQNFFASLVQVADIFYFANADVSLGCPLHDIGLPRATSVQDVIPPQQMAMYFPVINRNSLKGRYIQWSYRNINNAFRYFDCVIANSQFTKNNLQRYWQESGYDSQDVNLNSVLLGKNPAFKPADSQAINRLREKYQLQVPFLLYVGALGANKNLRTLFEALQLISNSNNSNPLLVITGPKDDAEQAYLTSHYPQVQVKWLSYCPYEELPTLYSAAQAFVFPSLIEGFGLPPLEAMAAGTPVICSSAASLPEVTGDAALLFDPHDSVEIAAAIVQMTASTELQAQYREKGLKRAAQLTWQATANNTWHLLEEAVAIYKAKHK